MKTHSYFVHSLLVVASLLTAFSPAAALAGDAPGIFIDPTSGVQTAENGASAQLTVVLDFPPTADVILSIQSSDPAEGTVDPAQLIFTLEQWDLPQVITVTGQPDEIDDGDQVYEVQFAVASDDGGYDALSVPPVPVTNADVDTAGIVVAPITGLQTDENGATDQFSVSLGSRPTSAVTVLVASQTPSEAAVSPASITIQPANWSQAVVFTVTGQPDQAVDGDQPFTLALDVESDDPLYAAQTLPNVTGLNSDVDSAGAIVMPTAGLVTTEDGATDTFTVTLTSRPDAAVTVHAASDTPSEAAVSPESVTMLPDDWDQPAEFTVTGVADNDIDEDAPFSISLSASSADSQYDGIALPTVTGVNQNVDVPPDLAAVGDSYLVNEDALLEVSAPGILVNDTGPGTLTVVLPLEAAPSVGVLDVQEDGSFTYTPPEDFFGEVSFQYRATDGTNSSAAAVVTIDVQPVNDPPVAAPDAYLSSGSLNKTSSTGVLANDSDVDDSGLTAELHTDMAPSMGTVSLNSNGSFTYTAASGFEGQATFTYRAYDGEAYSQPATVTITVDRTKPAQPVWISPPTNSETYTTTGGDVLLQVTVPADAVRVRMFRWDHVVEAYFDMAIIETAPFAITIDAADLPTGQNQIFAVCYDAAGNQSERKRIIIHLLPIMEPQAYLPMIIR